MYIVRWLIGHPMIAVWVLGAIAILLTYGSTTNKQFLEEHRVTTTSEEVSTTLETQTSEQAIEGLEVTNDSNDLGVVNRSAFDSATNMTTSLESNDANESTDKDASILNMTSTVVANSNDNDKSEVTVENNTSDDTIVESAIKEEQVKAKGALVSTASLEVEKIPDNKSSLNNNETEVADLGQLSSDEMLKMAREAYWNNGLDEATQIYQQLIKMEPKVVEHRGELGNVYWRQGFPKKAAEIYSEIAIPMIEKGNSDRVANMIGFIGLFYPDRASVIHDRLQTKSSKVE